MALSPGRRKRLFTAVGVGVVVWVAGGSVAAAHVEAEAVTGESGLTDVSLSFHHGCDGAATTALKVRLPDGATEVVPRAPAGWTASVGDGEVTWSGTPIPDGQSGEFGMSMRVPGAAGTVVFLPTVQQCGEAELAWIGQGDDPEADDAAPRFTLSRDVAAAPTTTAVSTTVAAPSTTSPTSISTSRGELSEDEGTNVSTLVAVLGVAVLVLGAAVVVVRRRGPAPRP